MRALLPYLALYKRHKWLLTLGVVLAIVTLLASIGLLTLSGWFLSASAVVGVAGIYSFNYMLPAAGVRGAAIIRTAGRYFERLVSHDATFRVLQHLRVATFSKLLPLSPAGLARFRQGELLNRIVADVDTLDHLYLRVISPLVGALVVILVVTIGLSVLDVTLALTLGGIMLATLLLLPPLFYRAGKPTGEQITQLRGQYRQQLTSWLQGQAELMLFNASDRYRKQMEKTEQRWQEAQRRQAELTALSQALMLLIGGIAVIAMLWMASEGVGGNSQPGALIALFVFCALAAFEALAPVTGAFQHLGQVIASARRITQITEQQPEVTFSQQAPQSFSQVALTLNEVTFSYPQQSAPALKDISLQVAAGEHIAILGRTGCGKSTLLQLLTRAWDPANGQIQLNGQPLSELSETTLRQAMSVVPQRVHLFSATLRDNLLLAAPQASDARLADILERVGLEKLLEDSGLNSWLGEGGRQLSGGELRRLAIARALLHDAPLMLLDEPTEGLDATTESQILDLLSEVMRDKTVLMVTHRLRGLARFNQIIVMDNGQIIEQGSHAELLAKQGRYYQFKQRL
ncbi:heme ABC transporter ATP-binding protein/permease CydC [Klebsiella aerogenes]|uniref:Glutathione/L-cysteine transport system ATP-binding/permease protein CydC n=1 Tax=Klebsiella aerogenes (strain ATCC 13048 / DSM 30053 / CCUG 1429 / JCM 1235 / KCTC 2190 / NBRC 13534 / NCIMB 10102 / NCTC 10006 / CDC 819-56) TaxID=1028307 RepID=A0A0H3FTK6_KLEAK|nr:cysteine/glutathione ABC transporter ATP-binding protein/permease CydC [Klebsiella aerogenes]AEG97924.1 cysteine/glutathione ABC transporter membrane/ATP-binding component [Klebsiella aerogenes KCTC 2190]EKZ6147664.1 cysteine/glutathione ABC transporter ATP-binding protein/permease CydC [Klebsiella aerogenes]EKZ6284412.1 cysteine/glutathione ABC transporter ATP-binding protein/permease CydC [Klebsiella aerogenes]ELA0414854.1 cysteine/glutathione ABC transporter ATP-binding protein/permease C